MSETDTSIVNNFIRNIIDDDLKNKKHETIHTRFPPEPNGYLHVGHAKSICLNFGLAEEYPNSVCNLRFDDTNPEKEDTEYTDSIMADVKWLGFDWEDRLFYASDYFEKLYDYAVQLIKDGKAYVDDLNAEQIREYRGTLTEPGKNSPYRDRTVEENIDLFTRMRAGEFEEGEKILRAKIDMASPNMNMRDPAVYRIKKAVHHRTGDTWCIYPMYDFTHGLSDALENITHSLCTLEFEDHRPLYDWFIEQLPTPSTPRQIEFARLNLSYTITSKRKLNELVTEGLVDAWDDPRMPTITGMRRRGFTPAAIREFCRRIGVTKNDTLIDMGVLETCVREDLDAKTKRAMAVLKPIKVVIENYPEDKVEEFEVANHPKDESMGKRIIPFSREVYIDADDFMEEPPKKFFRLGPNREVRLRNAYAVKCHEVIKDDSGKVVELRCTYDPDSAHGKTADGRKIKGIIHWVSCEHAYKTEVRLYDRLFNEEIPDSSQHDADWKSFLNPEAKQVIQEAYLEPSLQVAKPEQSFQFERVGYFCVDRYAEAGKPVFNRTVTLRDSWAKLNKGNS